MLPIGITIIVINLSEKNTHGEKNSRIIPR